MYNLNRTANVAIYRSFLFPIFLFEVQVKRLTKDIDVISTVRVCFVSRSSSPYLDDTACRYPFI